MAIMRPLEAPILGIRFQDANIEAYLGDEVLGKGTLYISEEIITWIKEVGGEGFTIRYKKMSLHAISRDPNVHPRHCLYIMINGVLDADDSDDMPPPAHADDEEETTEVRFVPEIPTRIDEMYKAIQDCTLLHPDASSDMSDEDDEMMFQDDDNNYNDEPAFPMPLIGMGGGRIIPGNVREQQEQQIGALQNHFGARLRFVDGPLLHTNGNGSRSPTREELREMFEDDEEEEDEQA